MEFKSSQETKKRKEERREERKNFDGKRHATSMAFKYSLVVTRLISWWLHDHEEETCHIGVKKEEKAKQHKRESPLTPASYVVQENASKSLSVVPHEGIISLHLPESGTILKPWSSIPTALSLLSLLPMPKYIYLSEGTCLLSPPYLPCINLAAYLSYYQVPSRWP